MSDPATAAFSKARVAAVPSPLEGQGGGDRKTSAVGSPTTPNPSPRHGEARLGMDVGGGSARSVRLVEQGVAA